MISVCMTRVTYCLAAALFMCAATPSTGALTDAERIQFANGLYARGMYELAITEYKSFLREFPASKQADTARFRLGESYRRTGNSAAAQSELRHVVDKFPKSEFRFKAGFRLADLLFSDGKHKEAAEVYGKVIAGGPPDDILAASRYMRGIALVKIDKLDEGVRSLEEVRKHHADSEFFSYALLELGRVYGRKTEKVDEKRLDEALAIYAAVAEKATEARIAAEALFQMGDLHFRRRTFDRSFAAYRKLFEKYPDDRRSFEARLQAGWAAHNAGLYAEALRFAEAGVKDRKREAEHAEWFYLKANCERQLMQNPEAAGTYARLQKEYPKSRFAEAVHYERAVVCYKMGKFKDAIAEAEQMTLTDAVRKDVYWLLAESYAALDKATDAVQYYRLIARDFPKSDVAADAMYRLAHYLQERKEYKEAARYYTTLVQNFPGNELAPRALFASAFCRAKDGAHDGAARDWAALVEKYPSHTLVEESMYHKAMSEVRLERDKDAAASLVSLLKRFPKTALAADAHYWQGILLKKAGKMQDAEAELRVALKKEPGRELTREINFQLASVLHRLGKTEESAKLFEPLLGSSLKDEFSPEMLEWLAQQAIEKKDYDAAIKSAEILVKRSKDGGWRQVGWCLVGRAQLRKGDAKAAEKAYREALASKEGTVLAAESALRLGEIALAAKRYKHSGEYFTRASEMAAGGEMLGIRARAYAGLGHTAKGQRNAGAAARYFMSVAVLYDDPELVPECLYEAGAAFSASGSAESSKRAFDELVERYPKSEWAKKVGGKGTEGDGRGQEGAERE